MPENIVRLGDLRPDTTNIRESTWDNIPQGSDVFVLALPLPVSGADLAFATSHWTHDSTVVPNDANDIALKTACLELRTGEVLTLTNNYLLAKKYGIVEDGYYQTQVTQHSYYMVADTFRGPEEWPEDVPYWNLAALGRHEYERRQRGEPCLWADKQLPRWRIRRLPSDPSAYPMRGLTLHS